MRSKLFKLASTMLVITLVTGTAALLTVTLTIFQTEVSGDRAVKTPVNGSVNEAVYAGAYDYNRDNLIRFHVIANSDSKRDQAMKLKVRDRIVGRMTPEFTGVETRTEARKIVEVHLAEIREIALAEVRAWGEDYPVKVEVGNYDFPVKSYGNLTLPAGKYEAVRVIIGSGRGTNWWCVLFPPLCFVDASKQGNPDIDRVNPEKTEVRVKFKLLEILK